MKYPLLSVFRCKRHINSWNSVLNRELWCTWIKADTIVIHTCTLLFPDRAVDCWRASASGELYRVDSSAMTWLWIQLKRSISLKDITKPQSWLNYWYRYWSANATCSFEDMRVFSDTCIIFIFNSCVSIASQLGDDVCHSHRALSHSDVLIY